MYRRQTYGVRGVSRRHASQHEGYEPFDNNQYEPFGIPKPKINIGGVVGDIGGGIADVGGNIGGGIANVATDVGGGIKSGVTAGFGVVKNGVLKGFEMAKMVVEWLKNFGLWVLYAAYAASCICVLCSCWSCGCLRLF